MDKELSKLKKENNYIVYYNGTFGKEVKYLKFKHIQVVRGGSLVAVFESLEYVDKDKLHSINVTRIEKVEEIQVNYKTNLDEWYYERNDLAEYYKELYKREKLRADRESENVDKLKEELRKTKLELLSLELGKLGVQIKTPDGKYRSTYDILSDLHKVWYSVDCDEKQFEESIKSISMMIAGENIQSNKKKNQSSFKLKQPIGITE